MSVPILDNQLQMFDFKGLNINVPKDLIDDDQLTVAKNVLIRDGRIKKRMGIKLWKQYTFLEPPVAAQEFGRLVFLGFFTNSSRAEFYFYDTFRDSIYVSLDGITLSRRSNVDDVNAIYSNLLTPKNATSATRPIIALQIGANSRIVLINSFANGDGALTVAANCLGVPGKLLEHLDRFWIGQSDTLCYSNPGDITTMGISGGTNNIILPDQVWDIISIEDKILILTSDNLFVLNISGSPRNWSLSRLHTFSKKLDEFMSNPTISIFVTNSTSCAKNFVELDGSIYFLHPEGLYQTNGSEVIKLSDPVNPYFYQPTNYTRSSINLSIFSYRKKELIIKLTGKVDDDVNNQVKYLIYNTVSGSWSKVELAMTTPGSAPIFDPAFSSNNLDGIPHYTYDLVGFFHLFTSVEETAPSSYVDAIAAEGLNEDIAGTFAMTSNITNEPNKLFFFPEYEEEWIYSDDGNLYESEIETKTFDLGYRGINKKIIKEYLSIDVPADVDLDVTHVVNGTNQPPKRITPNASTRMMKIGGPGYFQEVAVNIADSAVVEDDQDGWELQTIGLDIINKAEQLKGVGN